MRRNVRIRTGTAILNREHIFGSIMLILSVLCVLLPSPMFAGQGQQDKATLAIIGAILIDGTDAKVMTAELLSQGAVGIKVHKRVY